MDFSGLTGLLAYYQNIDVFLLIMVRLFGFIIILPVFAGANIPLVVKISFALFLTAIVFSTGKYGAAPVADHIVGYVALILKEFLVGFITAFIVYMMLSVFLFIGQLVDFQVGFSMVSVFDPVSQIQVPITGNLFYLLVTFLFIQMGGLDAMIYTIARSYEVLPVGSAFLAGNASILRYVIDTVVDYFILGVKFSMPIVGTVMIVDIALGILTKAVPQMNVFVVGVPIKLLIGLIVLYMIIPAFGAIYGSVYDQTVRYVMNALRGMVPR
ncbi:MAG: flagellar biosynthetic protein FliR [Clostridiales bacterium]|jgi:flagellar biosynthetic protein FliR|nr:flagellar biosynthetic protein FliR [Clostridiales bacterium]